MKVSFKASVLLMALTFIFSVSVTLAHYRKKQKIEWLEKTGIASVYADHYMGDRGACGQVLHDGDMVAAVLGVPCGTRVEVENIDPRSPNKGTKIIVKRIDSGPYVEGRVIDLPRKTMRKLAGNSAGLLKVRLRVIKDEK